MSREVWRAIVGYPYYEVSDLGRVRSVDHVRPWRVGHTGTLNVRGKILRPRLTKKNGACVSVYRSGQPKPVVKRVSWLVLEAFVGPRPRGYDACHFPDKDPMNNRLKNLMWGSRAVNESHKKVHGTDNSGQRNGMSRTNRIRRGEYVREIRR
jgi:hypothetical protein